MPIARWKRVIAYLFCISSELNGDVKVRNWPGAVISVHTCYQSAVERKADVQKAQFQCVRKSAVGRGCVKTQNSKPQMGIAFNIS
jgi:hypothetical protein